MMAAAWERETWCNAQVNARLSELERDLAGVQKDRTLTFFQKSILSHMAVTAAVAVEARRAVA